MPILDKGKVSGGVGHMRRATKTIILAAIVLVGAWLVINRKQIRNPSDAWQLAKSQLLEMTSKTADGRKSGRSNPECLRIASFKINTPTNSESLELMAEICGQFDAIALQFADEEFRDFQLTRHRQISHQSLVPIDGAAAPTVRNKNKKQKVPATYWVAQLVGRINEAGFNYELVMDPRNAGVRQAILLDTNSLRLDASHWYTVDDPDDVMRNEPQVAWFRALAAPEHLAFTFSLVNIQVDGKRPDLELPYLAELFRAIRQDGRGEDDVIIAGDFNAGDRGLKQVETRGGLTWVISNTPTDTRQEVQFDNLVFSQLATTEFSGRGGVWDFMKRYNLRLDDALEVSTRMPVWAEFSIYEGHSIMLFPDEDGGEVQRISDGRIKNLSHN
jgi:hypothetical protein